MRISRLTALSLMGASALSGMALPLSHAGAQERDRGPLEEIVVTSRYRTESLQSVPLSVTVFTAQALEDARIDQVGDFISLTPNVTIAQAQNVGLSALTIRGVTQARNGEPPVATVVDGVLQINPNQFTQELFDIERIEILRGPQGALYGRNATGGAIIITTRQPTNEFDGHVRAGIGRGEERLVEGSVSGPIVEDKLLFRVGARYYDREGYLDNITTGQKADPYEDITVRGLLKWQATERFTADLRAMISRAEGGALNYIFQPANLLPDGKTLNLANPFDFTKIDSDNVQRNILSNNVGDNERNIDEFSLKLDYDAGFATFTSISSYNKLMEYAGGDQFPYTALATSLGLDGTQTQYLDVEAWSQEFRITSPSDQRLRWMFGAYYLDTERFLSSTTGGDTGQGIVRIERLPDFGNAVNPTLTFFADDNDSKAWALFGNIAYDVTDQIEAAVAMRYDEDKRTQRVSPLQQSGVPGIGQPGAVNKETFDKLQPKVSLRYAPNDDVTVYGSWGIGFRSGQFNQNGVAAVGAANGLGSLSDVVPQEETTTWEGGVKSQILNNRLRLNAALFHTKVENQQYFAFIGQVGAQILVPVDEVELIGGEIEAVARIADGFDIYASAGITDSKIKEYRVNPAFVGNKAPYVPDYTLNAGAQYRLPVTDMLGVVARVDYERRGRQHWDPDNSVPRSSLDLFNFRLGVEDNEGRWSLTGTLKNAFDEKYNSEIVAGGFAHPGLPRTWHLDFRYNF